MTEKEKQEKMRDARANAWYDGIWKTVDKCVFCDLREKYILHEENGIVLAINLYPYIDGHLLIISRKHISRISDLNDVQWHTVKKFQYISRKLIKEIYGIKNNWVMIREGGEEAQMTVASHLHIHIIPFDKKDLCEWNWRKLQYTPLENVGNYKKKAKDFIKLYLKYLNKHDDKLELPIVCSAIILNKDDEVLFQKRSKEYRLHPDVLTVPGGHVDDIKQDLRLSLAREVKEENDIDLDIKNLKLIDSRISFVNYATQFKSLEKLVSVPYRFLCNIYLYKTKVEKNNVKCSEECQKVVWLNKEKIEKSEVIHKDVKDLILQVLKSENI